jgi:hypothetical protein
VKIRFVTDGALPGAFVIEAATPEECLLLRNFIAWPDSTGTKHRLFIGNHGGNIAEHAQSMMIHWRKESDFMPG